MRRKGNRHQPGSAHGPRGSQGPLVELYQRLRGKVFKGAILHVEMMELAQHSRRNGNVSELSLLADAIGE